MEKRVTHWGSANLGAQRGFGVGLRVRRENGSTRSVADNGSRSCRIREEELGWRRGHIGSALVGADLVVTKILSGPRIGSVLAFGKKNLACDVVGIGAGRRYCRSVSVTLA